MDSASGSNSTTAFQNTQNSQAIQPPIPSGTQEKTGFFEKIGGISKSVGKSLGVEVGSENVIPVAPQPQIIETPTQAVVPSVTPPTEVNVLNDTVFKENPAEFLTKGEDGQLHLDSEKLQKAANKYLMNPENLKKVIEANPHLKEELAGAGIRPI